MLTDKEIISIAKEATKEDEVKVSYILDLLAKNYKATGRYGLCVMLYAVAYEMGLKQGSELIRGFDTPVHEADGFINTEEGWELYRQVMETGELEPYIQAKMDWRAAHANQ